MGNSRRRLERTCLAVRGGPLPGAKIGPRGCSGAGDGTLPICPCHRSRLGPDKPSRGRVFPGGTAAQRFRAHGERSGPGNWRVSPRRPPRAARRHPPITGPRALAVGSESLRLRPARKYAPARRFVWPESRAMARTNRQSTIAHAGTPPRPDLGSRERASPYRQTSALETPSAISQTVSLGPRVNKLPRWWDLVHLPPAVPKKVCLPLA